MGEVRELPGAVGRVCRGTRTVPVVPTPPRTDEKPNERTSTKQPADREEPKMRESGRAHDREERIQVRWGLDGDEAQIATLLELNGMRRALASEERFIVAAAKPGGKVLAALRYRTEPKRLLLGLLVSDPWAQERPLAVALYAGAGKLAREMGAREVLARSVLHADDYPHEAGYRRRHPGGWYLDTTRPFRSREGLPAGGWQRMVALLGVPAVPFFGAFSGAGLRTEGPGCSRPNDASPCPVTERPQRPKHTDGLPERRTRDERVDGLTDMEAATRGDDARGGAEPPGQSAAGVAQEAAPRRQ